MTGGKHSVPLANIFLTYILRQLLRTNNIFNNIFKEAILLWKRFIDDGGGALKGDIQSFVRFFRILQAHFRTFELELTADTNTHAMIGGNLVEKENKETTFLDIDMFVEGRIHTKEHRKETSATSYLHYTSAHPRYIFKGIMKSQLLRIRRLCSREDDYLLAVEGLRSRCVASGYRRDDIEMVFAGHEVLPRNLYYQVESDNDDSHQVRLVTLAGTVYQSDIDEFARRMNRVLSSSKIKVAIVKTTSPSLAKLLFHNNNSGIREVDCGTCFVCENDVLNREGVVHSNITGKSYMIPKSLSCQNGGIYVYGGPCMDQYSGKTTVPIGTRTLEHIRRQKDSSVYKHRRSCAQCNGNNDFLISLVEDYRARGKYTLSEREYLWNFRIKGVINCQRTLLG